MSNESKASGEKRTLMQTIERMYGSDFGCRSDVDLYKSLKKSGWHSLASLIYPKPPTPHAE